MKRYLVIVGILACVLQGCTSDQIGSFKEHPKAKVGGFLWKNNLVWSAEDTGAGKITYDERASCAHKKALPSEKVYNKAFLEQWGKMVAAYGKNQKTCK